MGNVKAVLVGAIRSLFCSLLLLSTAYARADAPGPQPFDIRPQGLAEALRRGELPGATASQREK